MTPRPNTRATTPTRRGFGSVIAIILLSIASIVIVGLATPGADRAIQNAYAVDSIRAGLAADAGVAILLAAVSTAQSPAVPPTLASEYDIVFTTIDVAPETDDHQIIATWGSSTRTVQLGIN